MKRNLIILLSALVLLAVYLGFFHEKCDCEVREEIKIGQTVIKVLVRDSNEERREGLSGKFELKEDEGMLFVFDRAEKHGFWMKDMNFPIDIVWIGSDKRVLGVEKGVRPETYPKIFYPPEPVLYVLEVNSGFSDTWGIEAGQLLSWSE